MNATKIVTIGAGLVLLTITAFLLHNRRTDPAPSSSDAAAQWTYKQFDALAPAITENGKHYHLQLVNYHTDAETLKSSPVFTNHVYGADDVLTDLGHDGWQFVSATSTNYLVRRAGGNWKYDYFIVGYDYPDSQ